MRYVVLGQLARGASSDVFLARRDARLTETVVLKIARGAEGAERVAREWKTLVLLDGPPREGSAFFTRILPLRVLHGKTEDGRVASVFRWRAGFQFTLEDVRREYGRGVDARALVWMWKRLLELLGWVHDGGFSHGALDPTHVLVHPRDHGVHVVGWSRAGRGAGADDVAASARVMNELAGADAPAEIRELLRGAHGSAWAVRDALDRAAHDAFGPSRFHRFTLAGWG